MQIVSTLPTLGPEGLASGHDFAAVTCRIEASQSLCQRQMERRARSCWMVGTAIRALAQWYVAERNPQEAFADYLRRMAGFGLEKAEAAAVKAKLKERVASLCAYKEGELTEADLSDFGADKQFAVQISELGSGECMA